MSASDPSKSRVRRPLSLADEIAVPMEPSAEEPLPILAWVKIGILGLLVLMANFWQMVNLASRWVHDPDWAHGALIPLFSLYLLFARRSELRAARRRTCLWGLPVFLFGILAQIVCYYPIRNDWLYLLNLTVTLFGLVLYLAGPQIIRLTWLPIFFLVMAFPMPPRLYTAMALPLQEFAALVSTIALRLVGVDIDVQQSHMTVVSLTGHVHPLTVAEACSGMRSLLAFVALGVATAYLENRPAWQRVILVIAAVPIAILCNVIRVSLTCTMFVVDRPELGKDIMHEFMGMAMLAPAFLMLWGLGWLLRRLVVEEDEEERDDGSRPEGLTT